ncbi:F-box/WD repeat-containing protein 9-like [Ruditapes philippinarum]|uniref:F-box/WD repeat-containing protein 9-like n=1 Tax=Ruditapes philippinarum TaxID=129788 RepID=UPI00295C36B4|nr:F-box/WD repeat-containing protein 9-like [Ruditapes philippinarum]XP_060568685.1 F-box/WD repeat-containing protein 9-like [Ruditapes philippinarum]XP_060568693.1 F-box/WD repeat-containing protein 9-like [Ruditapes philippinarum]
MSENNSVIDSGVDTDLIYKMELINDINKGFPENTNTNADNPENPDFDEDNLVLTDLPSEILIHIASYLESRTIGRSLYSACKKFYELFSSDRYWRTRISKRWTKQYPVFEREDFNWHKACMEREEVHKLWSNPDKHFNHFILKEGFFAAVDVVHLMKEGKFLAVGSRDRHFNIVDLTKYDCAKEGQEKDLIVASETKAHKGWVWSMASYDDTLVTGSWDTFIRLWDFNNGAVTKSSEIKLKTAILGLYYEPNFIAACGFDKRLYMLDPRSPDDCIKKHYHSQPVLSVVADDKYVITGSEDKSVAIYDRVAGKKYKTFKTESFVPSMSYQNNQLWMGDKAGKLNVMDTTDGLFDESLIKTFDIGNERRLTGLVPTDGGIFTSSDSIIKIVEPSSDPAIINSLNVHSGEIARISHNNGVLASAGSDISVGVWIPKSCAYLS